MNEELIQKILDDIYIIDADLKKEEKQLKKIIVELLNSKPEIKLDDNFISSLRKEILHKVQEIEASGELKNEKFINIINLNFMKKFYYAGAGLVVVMLLVAVIFSFNSEKGKVISQKTNPIDLKSKISRIDSNAFGSFASMADASKAPSPALNATSGVQSESVAVGMGGGGRSMLAADSASGVESKMMPGYIMPEYTKYTYVYEGEEFEIPASADVYKKVSKEGVGREMAQRLGGNFGLLDMDKFQNNVLTNFNISEDREFGYNVYFDLVNNSVSINQNWDKWPQPGADCRDEACYKSIQMKIENIPADEEIIALANQAVADYGVDVSAFGEPRVNNSWRQYYDFAEDKENYYIPDTISVIYPLKLEGKEVNDDYGNSIGITVDVNVRYKKMAGIQGIALNDFQASSYQLETDKERIMKFAKQGGLWSGYMPYGNPKLTDITLGTPSLGLVSNWKYNEETGRGEDYYVPALIFPITSKSEDVYFNRKTVSVPLLKEILDQAEANDNGGIIPMMRTGVEEGTVSTQVINSEPAIAPAPMVKTIE